MGAAVNCTVVPEQILVASEVMLIDGATVGLMFTTMVLLKAVGIVLQVALEVSMQLTKFPLTSVEGVKVGLFVPWFMPFTLH